MPSLWHNISLLLGKFGLYALNNNCFALGYKNVTFLTYFFFLVYHYVESTKFSRYCQTMLKLLLLTGCYQEMALLKVVSGVVCFSIQAVLFLY